MFIWIFSAYDQPGGQSTRSFDYAQELSRRGHSVRFFTNNQCHFTGRLRSRRPGFKNTDIIGGVDVIWLPTVRYAGNGWGRGINMLHNFVLSLWYSLRIRSASPDVTLGPSVPLFTGLAAYLVAKRYRASFVFEIRDVWPQALVDARAIKPNGFVYSLFRFVEMFLYQRADLISSALPYVQEHVAMSGGNADHVTWIPNGIDIREIQAQKPAREHVDSRFLIMYVGGFGIDHDIQTIINCAQYLESTRSGRFSFALYGHGENWEYYKELASSLTNCNLEIHEAVEKRCTQDLQQEADLLVAAITDSPAYAYGLNLNKLVSYMVSGRPIVLAGNPPNNPVRDSGAGITVPAGDYIQLAEAIKEIAARPAAERDLMGRLGMDYVRRELDMRILGDRMEALLSEACNVRRKVR